MAAIELKEATAAAPTVVLRRATPAETRQMLELVGIAIGRGSVPRTEAFWRWKHEQNPFGPSPAMVAEADGRIVSLRIFLRWRWLYGKYAYAAVRPVDTATHPDWRRRGLFERLTRELLQVMKAEGVAFVFNTPNATSGRGYEKLGWRMVGRPTIWCGRSSRCGCSPNRPARGAWPRRAPQRFGRPRPRSSHRRPAAFAGAPACGSMSRRRRRRLLGLALRDAWPRLRRDGRRPSGAPDLQTPRARSTGSSTSAMSFVVDDRASRSKARVGARSRA
jgi:GNAT superfamily N-acetyltransferase